MMQQEQFFYLTQLFYTKYTSACKIKQVIILRDMQLINSILFVINGDLI